MPKVFKLGDLPLIVEAAKPLQRQVLARDICPVCHEKTLGERKLSSAGAYRQCEKCNTVWMDG